jgi:hypothetical protein
MLVAIAAGINKVQSHQRWELDFSVDFDNFEDLWGYLPISANSCCSKFSAGGGAIALFCLRKATRESWEELSKLSLDS